MIVGWMACVGRFLFVSFCCFGCLYVLVTPRSLVKMGSQRRSGMMTSPGEVAPLVVVVVALGLGWLLVCVGHTSLFGEDGLPKPSGDDGVALQGCYELGAAVALCCCCAVLLCNDGLVSHLVVWRRWAATTASV